MPYTCFCPGCDSGYKKTKKRCLEKGERPPSLFRPPKDPELFQLWKKSIPRADRELKPCSYVCQKHFREEDIILFHEVKLFNGNIWRTRRERATLRRGAIPCMFSNVPGHSTYKKEEEEISNRKYPKKRKKVSNAIKKRKVNDIIKESNFGDKIVAKDTNYSSKENDIRNDLANEEHSRVFNPVFSKELSQGTDASVNSSIISDFSDNESLYLCETINSGGSATVSEVIKDEITEWNVFSQSLDEEQFSFKFLKINLHKIEKINVWWSISDVDNFIICARWNSDCDLEKKIVVHKDMTVKVYLKEKETSIGKDLVVRSFDNLSKLLRRVESTKICPGITNKESNCTGFLLTKISCKKHNLCLNCIKYQQKVKRRQPLKSSEDQVELIRFNLV